MQDVGHIQLAYHVGLVENDKSQGLTLFVLLDKRIHQPADIKNRSNPGSCCLPRFKPIAVFVQQVVKDWVIEPRKSSNGNVAMFESLFVPHAGKITAMQSSDKANLRLQILSNRPQSSEGLFANLVRIAMETQAQVIASYSPLKSEPDVREFNDWAIATGRELLLPRVATDRLEFAAGETAHGAFGLQEPTGVAVNLGEVELILVPALAVDSRGYRLGKGKGYYDRILGEMECPKFAVIFDGEFFDQLPVEAHDQKVSGAVSPLAINYFSGLSVP